MVTAEFVACCRVSLGGFKKVRLSSEVTLQVVHVFQVLVAS